MSAYEINDTKMCSATLIRKSAFLELTFNCSFACPFCYVPWLDHPELYGKQLDSIEWIDTIDSLLAMGVEDVTLTGGEPLLHSGCKTILRHLRTTKASFCLYTNCELVDQEVITLMRSAHGEIATSLQGIKHRDRLTGSSFPLTEWERRCRNIVSNGIPLSIAIPITKPTFPETGKLISKSISLMPKKILINPIIIEGRAKFHPELWLAYQDYLKIQSIVERFRCKTNIPLLLAEERFCRCRGKDIVFPPGEPIEQVEMGDKPYCHQSIIIGPDGRRRQCLHTFETIGKRLVGL